MYQLIDNRVLITVKDWESAGLSYKQYNHDLSRGYLSIYRRGINGNTQIDVKSIRRPDRLAAIERAFGKVNEPKRHRVSYHVDLDTRARDYYINYRKPDGAPLDMESVTSYTNRASILNGLRNGLQIQLAARAKAGTRIKMGDFYEEAVEWYLEQTVMYPCTPIANARSLERIFKKYVKEGYESLIHGNQGNDAARKVSVSIENLLMSLWRMNEKPFISEVHSLYLSFVAGDKELHDTATGEIYNPEDFRHKGRAMEVSTSTVWSYLKDVVNETSVFAARNGNFEYVNTKRPKHHRSPGKFSLSKITMDDVAMSRKSVRGWVYKYIAVDVVSGYWFRPAYVVGKPTHATVNEAFRNMFCELAELDLPMPGELEVEYHLMQDMKWLNELFPFVRFCESPTEKRAEHAIKALKYGVAKREGHTRGRWYAKHEAFRTVRNKMNGDFIEPEFQPQTIVADDLADIEKHNNELHPLQKTYPGMTRREVLLSQVNPILQKVENWHLYRFIGNETQTSIYNNDFVRVQGETFEISDFKALKRLKPNNLEVMAYWMPEANGTLDRVYIYQDGNYIGEAVNRTNYDYNECAIERTDADEANILHQQKRVAKYDKFVKERRADLPKLGKMDASKAKELNDIQPDIIEETTQPVGYMEDEYSSEDWITKAIKSL